MSIACLVFALYLNQMSHPTMFPTRNLIKKGRGIIQEIYILSCRMDTFLFLCMLYFGFAVCLYSGICWFQFKQAEMDACMNWNQQIPEYKKIAKPQCNMQRNKNVSIRHNNISKFCLIPCPLPLQMTRWKHCQMTHIVNAQRKTKQALAILH